MLLFPYAKDIDYADQHLSFVISFLGRSTVTEVNLKMKLDDDLSELIEELFDSIDGEI